VASPRELPVCPQTPAIAPPLFLPALRRLSVSVLLYGPTSRTIGVAISPLNEAGETVYSAALAGIALIIIVTGEVVIKRFFKTKEE